MTFKEYIKLREEGTSTANIAVFTQPIGMIVRRTWGVWSQDQKGPELDTMKWGVSNEEKPVKKKKHKKRKKS